MAFPGERIYRISEITAEVKGLLENTFASVSVEGEISNFRPSSTGHYYFTLKDRDAVLQAVMFRNRAVKLGFTPKDGLQVVARGGLSVYPQRGTYQIICESLEQAGEGAILAMLEERKQRLALEGLFDPARKKPLPLLPERVAVVTSPTGAAVRDILKVLKKRNAGIDVVVLPAPVQGEGADEKLAAQVRRANLFGLGDVIILGRGGGSLEDLLPFSSEVLVRAVAESKIPVISAVGHEIDFSLCDFAADYRAPTPSAAAETVAAAQEELIESIRSKKEEISRSFDLRVERLRNLLDQFSGDNLERHLRMLLQPTLFRLDDAKEKLLSGMNSSALAARHRLEVTRGRLESCSPFDILKRGYSIVRRKKTGAVLVSSSGLAEREELTIRFHEGEVDASVEKIR